MFDDILKIKTHKEERALRHVEECRGRLAEAEQALIDGQKQLEDYKIFRQHEKVRIFQKIQREQVSMQKVDEVNRDIAKLKEQELAYIQRLEQLRQELAQSKENLEQARIAHRKARTDVEKYEEIKKVVDEDQRKENEAREELELEGISRPSAPAF